MVRSDQQRVRSLLAEAITILCKNCLAYKSEFTVEGLLGITLDQDEVFLVNIKENISDGSGGQDTGQGPEFLQPEQLLGLNQQNFTLPQLPPQRPSRVVPVSRPLPAKSPFMPKRTSFGNYRGRGRGRGRGRHPVRPPSRQVSRDSGGPPGKRPHLDIPAGQVQTSDTEPIEIKEEDDEDNQKDADEQDEDNNTEDSGQATGSKSNDALVSLDFGDMLQQYEDTPSNLQEGQMEGDDDSMAQDDTEPNSTAQARNKDVLIIKPDPEAGDNAMTSPSQSNSNSDSMFTSSPMDSSGAMYPGAQSGPLFPGQSPGQFMDPNMPSFSGWGQPQVPSTQSMSSYTPRSKPNTPRKSGPGRPSAAAGSPAQGGSPQVGKSYSYNEALQRYLCHVCHKFTSSKLAMDRHYETIHRKDVMYPCNACGKYFSRKDSRQRHYKVMHGKNEKDRSGVLVLDEGVVLQRV